MAALETNIQRMCNSTAGQRKPRIELASMRAPRGAPAAAEFHRCLLGANGQQEEAREALTVEVLLVVGGFVQSKRPP